MHACMQCMGECNNYILYAVQLRPMWQEKLFRTPDSLSTFRGRSWHETTLPLCFKAPLSFAFVCVCVCVTAYISSIMHKQVGWLFWKWLSSLPVVTLTAIEMKGTKVPNPRRSSACDSTCVLTRNRSLSRDSHTCHEHCFVPDRAKFAHEFPTLFHRPCAAFLADFTLSDSTAPTCFIIKLFSLANYTLLFIWIERQDQCSHVFHLTGRTNRKRSSFATKHFQRKSLKDFDLHLPLRLVLFVVQIITPSPSLEAFHCPVRIPFHIYRRI